MSFDAAIARISEIRSTFETLSAPRVSSSSSSFSSVFAAASAAQPGVLGTTGAPASWASVDRPASMAGASSASAPVSGNEKQLSPDQLNGILYNAGFRGDALRTAWAIAMRESSGQPGLVGPVNGNGTRDYGLFQFNDVHRGGWVDFDRVFDPVYAAEAAFRMSKGGTDFSAWALGDSGWAGQLQQRNPEVYQKLYDMWKDFYDQYPDLVTQV